MLDDQVGRVELIMIRVKFDAVSIQKPINFGLNPMAVIAEIFAITVKRLASRIFYTVHFGFKCFDEVIFDQVSHFVAPPRLTIKGLAVDIDSRGYLQIGKHWKCMFNHASVTVVKCDRSQSGTMLCLRKFIRRYESKIAAQRRKLLVQIGWRDIVQPRRYIGRHRVEGRVIQQTHSKALGDVGEVAQFRPVTA